MQPRPGMTKQGVRNLNELGPKKPKKVEADATVVEAQASDVEVPDQAAPPAAVIAPVAAAEVG